jgi:hypothetical protein
VDVGSERVKRHTEKCHPPPRPEACLFSPDGSRVAYARTHSNNQGHLLNQLWVTEVG